MKKILYTQRVDIIESYGERRDCADIEIANFIWECGYMPIPINNIPKYVREYVEQINPVGIVLTGGNDLAKYGGNAPERDETEKRLIEYGMENNIPIYGFCRGMQMIADYFGAQLNKVQNHVRIKHQLIESEYWKNRVVNSYHNMAVKEVVDPLIVEASTEDGVIEAIRVKGYRIYGTMWHPEREKPYNSGDIEFLNNIFK